MLRLPRTRHVLVALGGITVVALLLVALLPEAVPVDVGTVDRGALEVIVRHEGRTRVRQRFTVSAPVAGTVSRIDLLPGDHVQAGVTVLATIEPLPAGPLDERARRDAEAGVRAAEAELARARAERERLAARSRYAEEEERRIVALFAERVVAARERDRAESEAAAARRALDAADAAVTRARFALDAARARLLPAGTSGRAAPVVLRSPIDGVILQRFSESEASVTAGTPLLELADVGRLEVWADFLSTDAVRFRPGMRAIIDGWGGREPLAARVRLVEPHAFMKVSALGVEEQRVGVILDLVDPVEAWNRLGDGYRVRVGVVVERVPDALRVPASALFRDDAERWAVFRLDGRRARLTAIEVGPLNGLQAVVRKGLEEGDRVVLHPSDSVRDGVRVRPRRAGRRRR